MCQCTQINHSNPIDELTGAISVPIYQISTFVLEEDTEDAAPIFTTSTRYFQLAESLGGVKSLLCHPATMTHKSIPAEKCRAAGVADGLIRLSVGLEGADDLIEDLQQALEQVFLQTEKLASQV